MMIDIFPVHRDFAFEYIRTHHSHHKVPPGWWWGLGAEKRDPGVPRCSCNGVLCMGRPVAAPLQDGVTYEVTRLCTDGTRNVASCLLGAARRACRAMGVRRLVSYIREDEQGTCYKAAGWSPVASVRGRPHTTGNRTNRWLPGFYEPTTEIIDRVRWEVVP